MATVTEFRLDGGATWLNLLATQGQSFGLHPVERIPTPEAASHWLSLVGFPLAAPMPDHDLRRLVSLREALRDLAMAVTNRRDPSPDALAVVSDAASNPAVLSLAGMIGDHGFSVDAALGAIATQALVTLQGPDRTLLKECAEVDCRWVFLDTSGRRHWCPSPACASRGRVRAHRLRQAAPSIS